nr:unnamed protein product [Digitaria exilis]
MWDNLTLRIGNPESHKALKAQQRHGLLALPAHERSSVVGSSSPSPSPSPSRAALPRPPFLPPSLCRSRAPNLRKSHHAARREEGIFYFCLCQMKTRSQTAPKPLKTVALGPRPGSPKLRQRPKPAGKGDPRAPKKPPTAFFYFMEDFRKTYKLEKPSVKSMQEIGKACGEKWNSMAFEEKVKYYDMATEKRAEFDKAMIEYNKKKETGEISEESDLD